MYIISKNSHKKTNKHPQPSNLYFLVGLLDFQYTYDTLKKNLENVCYCAVRKSHRDIDYLSAAIEISR